MSECAASSLSIRRGEISDIGALRSIYNDAIAERIASADMQPRTLEDRTAWFAQFNERYPLWVATIHDAANKHQQTVVAYAGIMPYSPREGYRYAIEHCIYVSRHARGHGYGQILLKYLLLQAKQLGYHYIIAKIFCHNVASIALHHACGFMDLAIQKKIIEMDGQWYDVIMMDKRL